MAYHYTNTLDLEGDDTPVEQIVMSNFREAMLSHSFFVSDISFGSHKYETEADPTTSQNSYKEIISRAYVIGFMPRALSRRFLNEINTTQEKVAEPINIIRTDLFSTINQSLVPNIPISYYRVSSTFNELASKPYKKLEHLNLLDSSDGFAAAAAANGITADLQDIVQIVVIDPKTSRQANATGGLFNSIYDALIRAQGHG